MQNGIATCSLPHEYFVIQVNGRANSIHRRYGDALRAGLLLKYQYPRDEIRVWEINAMEEAARETVLH